MANKTPIKLEGGKLKQYASTDTVPASNVELDTDVTLAANSDTRIASQKAVKAYVAANGGGTTIYNGDGSLAANRTVDLNGKFLHIAQGANDFLVLDPTVDNEQASLAANNITGSGNTGAVTFYTNATTGNAAIAAVFNGGAKIAQIAAEAYAGAATLVYTADKHTFLGEVISSSILGKTIFISNANYVL